MKGGNAALQRRGFLPSVLILPLSGDTGMTEGAQQCAIRATVGWEDVTVEQMRLEINICMILGKKKEIKLGLW